MFHSNTPTPFSCLPFPPSPPHQIDTLLAQTHAHTHTKCGVTWCGWQRQNVRGLARQCQPSSENQSLSDSYPETLSLFQLSQKMTAKLRAYVTQVSPYLQLTKSFPWWITHEYTNMGCRYFVFRLIRHSWSQIAPLHKKNARLRQVVDYSEKTLDWDGFYLCIFSRYFVFHFVSVLTSRQQQIKWSVLKERLEACVEE